MSEVKKLQLLIDSHLNEFKSLGDYLRDNEQRPKEIGAGIAQKKAENPDLTYLDVKEDLVKMQTVFMDNEMVRSNIQLFATRLASIYDIANAMSVELTLSPEDEMLLANIKEATSPFFTVKNGQLLALDQQEYDIIRQNFLNKAMEDETMRVNFNAISFKRI